MKSNKIKALLGSEKGHKEIEIPFYTKSQVDAILIPSWRIREILNTDYPKDDFTNREIFDITLGVCIAEKELKPKIEQLKAKLKEQDIMDKMIEQLLNKNKQLKAKLKEQEEYYEKLIETLDKNYPSDCSKVRPIDVQRMWDIITNYNVEEKKWVGKE